MSSLDNEKGLLRLVSEGNEAAFRQLFRHYGDLIYNNINAIIHSEVAAKDLVQDTFLRVWLHRDKLPAIENFRAWLLRIAYNRSFTYLRDQKSQQKNISQYAEQTNPDQSAEEMQLVSLKDIIQQAIHQMPPQQKKIYLLSREQGLKISEIATRLGLAESTVKNTLSRALQTLREALEKGGYSLMLAILFSKL